VIFKCSFHHFRLITIPYSIPVPTYFANATVAINENGRIAIIIRNKLRGNKTWMHLAHNNNTVYKIDKKRTSKMGDRGPSKRMTIADFLPPPQPPPQPPATANPKNTDTNNNSNSNTPEDSTKSLSYTVRATKKGGVPCAVESRKHHKVVVLSNIEGDVPALLSALQKSLGTGGVRKGHSIEVQGEHHLEKIKRFCLTSGCVVGASQQNKAEAAGKKSQNNTKKNETTTNTTETTTTKAAWTALRLFRKRKSRQ
jgi:translation initiation factor 1 (eIF-1/SUI1)